MGNFPQGNSLELHKPIFWGKSTRNKIKYYTPGCEADELNEQNIGTTRTGDNNRGVG